MSEIWEFTLCRPSVAKSIVCNDGYVCVETWITNLGISGPPRKIFYFLILEKLDGALFRVCSQRDRIHHQIVCFYLVVFVLFKSHSIDGLYYFDGGNFPDPAKVPCGP